MLEFNSKELFKLKGLFIFVMLIFVLGFVHAHCGNGQIDGGEQCDGKIFRIGGCEDLDKGYTSGELKCNAFCKIDESACISSSLIDENQEQQSNAVCGDGIIQTGEQCDGQNMNGSTCESLGNASGEISCTGQCALNTSNCVPFSNSNNQALKPKLVAPEENTPQWVLPEELYLNIMDNIVWIILIAMLVLFIVGFFIKRKLEDFSIKKTRKQMKWKK
ncbi:MAG: hypothetical protein NTY48_04620 [Candidatus Diapherotrites archaeon]|nr:hypothetical protein [Candidatus Diapherotrites archaeon]